MVRKEIDCPARGLKITPEFCKNKENHTTCKDFLLSSYAPQSSKSQQERPDKAHLSERMQTLIYNPDLPIMGYRSFKRVKRLKHGWEVEKDVFFDFTDHQRLAILHGLFRLLNLDFQKQYAKYIEKLLAYKTMEMSTLSPDARTKQTDFYCTIEQPSLTDTEMETGNSYNSYLTEKILCNILLRRHFPLDIDAGWVDKDCDNVNCVVSQSVNAESFQDYCNQKLSGAMPQWEFLKIDVSAHSDTVLRQFTRKYEELQSAYFNAHPTMRNVITGHRDKQRLDDPAKLEQYYRGYVLWANGMSQKDMASELGLDAKDLKVAASNLLKRAHNLIAQSWPSEIFPAEPYS
jgi:hypothetical protein